MSQRFGLAAVLFAASALASATTYTVTSTADSGAGTLRQAITDANTSPGPDTIAFNIVGSGVQTIALASPLPGVTGAVTIDGYTQPGASPNTNPPDQGSNAVIRIELNAAAIGGNAGLDLFAASVVVRGLAINRSPFYGIRVRSGATGAVIAGNFIGTDPAGATSPGAQNIGIFVEGSNLLIGGTSPADRNVISGNSNNITVGSSNGLQVKGNLIGTDATGAKAVITLQKGLYVSVGTSVVIGGTTAAERNVMSGNAAGAGVAFGNSASVLGNYIGVDVSGTKALPNATGIAPNGAGGIIKGNVVSGNSDFAINAGAFVDGMTIQGNWIGTDEAETLNLGNGRGGGAGIYAYGLNWTIGGTAPGEGNVIAYNRGRYSGVSVNGRQARIRGNRMYGNRALAIDLLEALGSPGGDEGITANDLGDGDTGASLNSLQNFPLIGTVTPGVSTTNIQGTLNSTASTVFDLDFYAGPSCVPFVRESLQGQNYLGTKQVTTDGAGNVAFSVDLPVVLQAGQQVSATATDPLGNTSEVSQGLLFRLNVGYGPPAGTSASLFGMLFENGATVTVGGVAATNVNVVNAGKIDYTTPALPPGSANDVVVNNPSGSSGTLRRAYVASFNDADGIGFDDVIATLVANQVTAGCGTGIYCPGSNITRAQMAVFLLKGKYGVCYAPPAATGTVFPDVPANSFAAAWIEALAGEGITGGCGGGNYCPGNPVTRQQMAVFLMKAEHGSTYVPPTCIAIFSDVPCASPFAPWINQLSAEGITGGCGSYNYCPLNNATRAQMAAFIVKTFSLQ
jgi:hypothetical protein